MEVLSTTSEEFIYTAVKPLALAMGIQGASVEFAQVIESEQIYTVGHTGF